MNLPAVGEQTTSWVKHHGNGFTPVAASLLPTPKLKCLAAQEPPLFLMKSYPFPERSIHLVADASWTISPNSLVELYSASSIMSSESCT